MNEMGKHHVATIYATVYNNASVVESSLNSIIKQFPNFYTSFEFVIVDNYSNDGTWGGTAKVC